MKQPWTEQNATEKYPEATSTEKDAIDDILGEELPPEVPGVILKAAELATNDIQKVDYTGAQVWKVTTNETDIRYIISRLRRRHCKDFSITAITKRYLKQLTKYSQLFSNINLGRQSIICRRPRQTKCSAKCNTHLQKRKHFFRRHRNRFATEDQ